MNKRNIKTTGYLICLFFAIGIYSCLGPKIHELDFYSVSMNDPLANAGLGTVTLIGNVDDNAISALVDQGFLIADSQAALDNNEGNELTGTLDQGGAFLHDLTNLDLAKVYYLKAFAVFEDDRVSGQRKVYSEISWPFSLSIFLGTNESIAVINDRATVTGFITGLQSLGTSAEAHGFIYSTDANAALELGEVQSLTLELGLLNDDSIFMSTLADLDLNTTYYVRTFAQTSTDIYYSDEVRTFETVDGWKLSQSDGFELCDGFGLATNDKAYFLGCVNCGVNQNCENLDEQDLYSFDPTVNNGQGEWTDSDTDMTLYARHESLSFQIGDTLYFGTGQSTFITSDMRKIHINDIGTEDMEGLVVTGISLRKSAVAFVVNNKAYIGTGFRVTPNEEYLNDFWEYNPQTGSWREVSPLPLRETPSDPIVFTGRKDAMAFVFPDGSVYVGGGISGSVLLKDFWKFTPPTNAQDMGSWAEADFFEGNGRIFGVHFMMDGKAYFGTGQDISAGDEGYLSDFWMFDPSETPVFQQRTSIPDEGRKRAYGFSLGQNGYIGSGQKSIVNPDMSSTLEPLSDLWIYTPRQ